jgi:hypothetical protein
VEYSIYTLIILSTGSVGAMLCIFRVGTPEPKNIGGVLVFLSTIDVNVTFDSLGLYTVNSLFYILPCI